MTRIQRVTGYWRKIPDRPDAFATVHIELGRAYLCDQALREIERELSDMTPEQVARVVEWV